MSLSTVDSAWCIGDEYCAGHTIITNVVNSDFVDGICRLFNVYLRVTDAGVWKAGQANAVKRKWCQLCRHFRSVSRSFLWAVVCFCQLPLFWLADWLISNWLHWYKKQCILPSGHPHCAFQSPAASQTYKVYVLILCSTAFSSVA